ncbi:MAG: putative lipoprotein [Deltaproteobacteria bacterium]|nr:putative lipoprotein [Deltaproteobacteria bacterium]
MSPNIFQKKWVIGLLLVILLSVMGVGCSTTVKERQQGQPVTAATGETKGEGVVMGRYYLDDVRIPDELNYKPDESMVYETPKFKAGVLRFSKWRLDVQSLIDFFNYNMVKDNWTFVNMFKGKETQLTFTKPDKTCNIRITETWTGMTQVMIAVGPLGEKKM